MSKQPENPFKNYEDYLAKSPFQTIKLLLPFLPASNQKTMIILIKFMELKYTMEYFKKGNQLFSFNANLPEDASPLEKFSAIIDFLPQKEQESMEQILSMMSVMEAFQTMTGNEEEDDDEDEEDDDTKYTNENLQPKDTEVSGKNLQPEDAETSYENYFPSVEAAVSEENEDAAACLPPADNASNPDALSDITICSNIEF